MGQAPADDYVIRNECCTPDAVYGTDIWARTIRLEVDFPAKLLSREPEKDLVDELHAAILPVIERIYRDNWSVLAGKTLAGSNKPLPATWEELDPARFQPSPLPPDP